MCYLRHRLRIFYLKPLKKAAFYGLGSTVSRLLRHYEETVYLLPLSSRNTWHSFDIPRKDEKLNRSWNHPVVLRTGPLDWESWALTTRPFRRKVLFCSRDIQVFIFLTVSWFSKHVTSWWVLVHETGWIFEYIFFELQLIKMANW